MHGRLGMQRHWRHEGATAEPVAVVGTPAVLKIETDVSAGRN
jgi:hypothetical protein